nr:intraflagellar transport protein 81 [Hymenolepis microstoma]
MQDSEINKLYLEHEFLMEAFKKAHKQLESIKSESFSTCEVKNDIAIMQEEKDQLLRRINRMKKKLEMFSTSTTMLEVARKLRVEREREAKIAHQLQEQRIMMQNLEDKMIEIRQQSNDLQRRSADYNVEKLLGRLEEEVKINQFLATEKQPKEIAETKIYLDDLTRVASHPALTSTYLNQLNQKFCETQEEIGRLIGKHMIENDPFEDKSMIFRQQAKIVADRKASTASTLADARAKHLAISKQLKNIKEKPLNGLGEMRHSQHDNGVGLNIDQMSPAGEFQNYSAKSKPENQTYKESRAEEENMIEEKETLMETPDLLQDGTKESEKGLDGNEALYGMNGYLDALEDLEMESQKTKNLEAHNAGILEEVSALVKRLHHKIDLSRDKLSPLIKELHSLQEKAQELNSFLVEKQAQYDAITADQDTQALKLEQEVRDLREEVQREESNYQNLNVALDNLKVQESRLHEELRGYITSTNNSDSTNGDSVKSITVKRHSHREVYQKRINELEEQIEKLKEEQIYIDPREAANIRQKNIWADVLTLFEGKMISVHAGGKNADAKQLEVDRLLL